MQVNYHTHTWRCNHADPDERAYVEKAIENGLTTLGFSDHTPYHFPNDYYSYFRMRPDQMDDYVHIVSELKREYRNDIDIRLGLEAEYYPEEFDWLQDFLQPYPIEYLLLSQHFNGNEIGYPYNGAATDREDLLIQYVDQTIEAMRTGAFLYFAHPDIIHYTGNASIYNMQIERLCRCALDLAIPLEINLLGIMENRNYPCESFWQIAGRLGCNVILGSDAHKAENVLHTASYQKALRLVEKYELNLIDHPLI